MAINIYIILHLVMHIRISQNFFLSNLNRYFLQCLYIDGRLILSHEAPLNPKLNETTRKRRSLMMSQQIKVSNLLYMVILGLKLGN